ncbi:hypothetical protein COO60DRAFT_1217634 [Scenedesmus sp. NREL 46B-D3]|nr:hypothetical protein COO60DRAFT_1217634 [Scenedesmus sp. NREL 46B-D3]
MSLVVCICCLVTAKVLPCCRLDCKTGHARPAWFGGLQQQEAICQYHSAVLHDGVPAIVLLWHDKPDVVGACVHEGRQQPRRAAGVAAACCVVLISCTEQPRVA